jgi:hypothetical protein
MGSIMTLSLEPRARHVTGNRGAADRPGGAFFGGIKQVGET